ncbi:MAG TPA: GNAT family N-acetyltransferase [Kiloniellales bacterium]|jgi:GNAT superfamily N-acetyltransferase|nr:GNAT family N-acetyltransferase [Kiloniellales bacterium]
MQGKVGLRQADAGDLEVLAHLVTETFAFYGEPPPCSRDALIARLERHLNRDPGFEALIAEVDDEVVGYAIYAPVFWTSDCELSLFLKELYVRPQARGRRVGRTLMKRMAELAVERGWTKLVWTVDAPNRPARRFYNRLPGTRQLDKLVYLQAGDALYRFARDG